MEKIDKLGKKQRLVPCVLALAESSLYIASKSVFNKCKLTHLYSLMDLKLVSFLQTSIANLDFGTNQLKFTAANSKSLVTQIVSQARRLLTDEEFSNITISADLSDLAKSSPQSFLWRLQLQLNQLKEPMDISCINNLQTDIFYQNDTFKFNELPMDENVFPIFFNALCLNSGFKQMTFNPITEFDTFEILSKYFNFSSKIEKLTFKHVPTQFFPNFIEKFSRSQNSNLCSISFIKSEISDVELIVLFSVVRPDKLTSLTFAKSISHKQIMNLTTHECFFNLRSLTLQGVADLDIDSFAPFTLDLHSLSILDCGNTTLGQVVNSLSKYQSHNIHYLCVHSSTCGPLINKLPAKLKHIVADDIEWGVDEFSKFMSLCANHPIPLIVSVAHAKVADMEACISSFTQSPSSNICGITWDGNLTNSSLIVFLKKCPLTYVSMSGCPSKIPIGDLCMLLDNNNTIETLRVEGTKEMSLDDVTPICDMLPLLPNLREFDIAYQKISNAEIKYMSEKLAQCMKIEKIAFQGTNATSVSPFIDFAAHMMMNGRKVSIVWPYEDILRLTNDGKMTQDEEAELLARFQYAAADGDTTNPFDKPFSVFCGNMSIEFPRVLTPEKLKMDNHTEAYEIFEETVTETQSHYNSVRPIQFASRARSRRRNQQEEVQQQKPTKKNVVEDDEEHPVMNADLKSVKQWDFNDDEDDFEEDEEEEEIKPKQEPEKAPQKKNKKLGEMDWEFTSLANKAQQLPVRNEDATKKSQKAEEKPKKKGRKSKAESDDEEEIKPKPKKKAKKLQNDSSDEEVEQKPKKKKAKKSKNVSDSDEEIIQKPKKKAKKAKNDSSDEEIIQKPKKKSKKAKNVSDSDEEIQKPKKKGKNVSDKKAEKPKKKGKKAKEESDSEEKPSKRSKTVKKIFDDKPNKSEESTEKSFIIDAGNRVEGTPVDVNFTTKPEIEQPPPIDNSAFIRKTNIDFSLNALMRSMTL